MKKVMSQILYNSGSIINGNFGHKFLEKLVKQGKGSKAVFRKFIQFGMGGRP